MKLSIRTSSWPLSFWARTPPRKTNCHFAILESQAARICFRSCRKYQPGHTRLSRIEVDLVGKRQSSDSRVTTAHCPTAGKHVGGTYTCNNSASEDMLTACMTR